ncbi:MAG: hypothetical protein JKY15_05015 [Deltaproteobacteria bacterium]|nr:hypothetical protein [Deltaproteobacteria bacterium]
MQFLSRKVLVATFVLVLSSSNLFARDAVEPATILGIAAVIAAVAVIAALNAQQEEPENYEQPAPEPARGRVHERVNNQNDLMRRLMAQQQNHLRRNQNNNQNRYPPGAHKNSHRHHNQPKRNHR